MRNSPNLNKERFTENEYVEIWIENGIVYEVFKPDTILTIDVAKQVVIDRLKVSNEMTTPIFIDIRNLISSDSRARQYMASKGAVDYISAGAFLMDNELMRLLGNIFIKVDKPLIPTKLFTDTEKALTWLQSFKFLN